MKTQGAYAYEREDRIRKDEREKILKQIGTVDYGGCPYNECVSGGINCRDCLIEWLRVHE